ncbi:hypothetical protein M2157_007570 [Streptomyces sp. SAI-127]|nr:hypothetical protein [Streptomyces sp. SAI-127]
MEETGQAVHHPPVRPPRRPLLRPVALGLAQLDRGRARPALTGRDLPGDRRTRRHLGPLADPGAGEEDAARADDGVRTDLDLADLQPVAVQPPAGQVHLGLDGGAPAQLEHAGDRRQRVQVHVRADPGAQRPRVPLQPGAGQRGRSGELGESLGRPQPQVDAATARIAAGLHRAQQHARPARSDRQPSGRAEQQQGTGPDQPPRGARQPGVRQDVPERGERHQPAQSEQREQGEQDEGLDHLGLERHRCDDPRGPVVLRGLLQVAGQLPQRGLLVDVEDGRARVAGAQPGGQLGGGQAAAADREEVVAGTGDRDAEDFRPLLGEPGLGAVQLLRGAAGFEPLERPGQRVAVHLAGGPRRQVADGSDQRHERGGQFGPQLLHGRGVVPAVLRDDVPDEKLVAAAGGADGGGRSRDPGQRLESRVDLTQLDPPAPELDLLVGPAEEDEPLGLRLHEVTAAVRPLPAQRLQRRVLLRVLVGVQVPGQADPADHQLPARAHRHGLAGLVDDGQLPAVQRQPDPDRLLAAHQRGTGHHGRLGGPVGVPHLAPLRHQPLRQLGRTGLTAEDQQPYVVEGLGLPQRGERRHRGDDGDLLLDQPGPEIGPAPDLRTRHRHQTGPVPPGQPHLLAGRVEGDRQPRHDPVSGTDGIVGEEQGGLGVHEGGRAAVRDGDALGLAGGAGGEDDPRVVLDAGPGGGGVAAPVDGQLVPGADHGPDLRLPEHQLGPLVGVLGVDGDVRGARRQHGEDRDVQVIGAGRDPDADPVAESDPGPGEPPPQPLHLDGQRTVGEPGGPVVQGELVGVGPHGRVEDVDERAWGGGRAPGKTGGVAELFADLCAELFVEQAESTALVYRCHRSSRLDPGALRGAGGPQVCLGLSGSSS